MIGHFEHFLGLTLTFWVKVVSRSLGKMAYSDLCDLPDSFFGNSEHYLRLTLKNRVKVIPRPHRKCAYLGPCDLTGNVFGYSEHFLTLKSTILRVNMALT